LDTTKVPGAVIPWPTRSTPIADFVSNNLGLTDATVGRLRSELLASQRNPNTRLQMTGHTIDPGDPER
jgi:hypothetical protein